MTTTPLSRPRSTGPVRLPSGWVPLDPAAPPDDLARGVPVPDGVLCAAAAPRVATSGTRPALLLARGRAGVAVDPALLDEDDDFVDDQGRTVRYRRWQAAADLRTVCESWTWTDDDDVVTQLLAAVDIADYSTFTDLFEAVAESVDPDAAG
ncbi:hypothetical protein [Nocardioides sp. CFH 31398]|uniref:hypothetical protein n=1 Tax=Nocardioides sp. CFH 31398 TaxID=2919579 RepID=UPI001F052B56|nr:hypothetical protein [Nocardioides sp. CFH 31398]MCH1865026.1 hypothetical protein [Nocardioides sp. CFH 31398]